MYQLWPPRTSRASLKFGFCFLNIHECLRCLFHCIHGELQHFKDLERDPSIGNNCSFSRFSPKWGLECINFDPIEPPVPVGNFVLCFLYLPHKCLICLFHCIHQIANSLQTIFLQLCHIQLFVHFLQLSYNILTISLNIFRIFITLQLTTDFFLAYKHQNKVILE